MPKTKCKGKIASEGFKLPRKCPCTAMPDVYLHEDKFLEPNITENSAMHLVKYKV